MKKPLSASSIPRRRFMLAATASLLAVAAPPREIAGATERLLQEEGAGLADTKWHEARRIIRTGRIGTLYRCQGAYDGESIIEALSAFHYVAQPGLPERVSVLGGVPAGIGMGRDGGIVTRGGGIVTLFYARGLTIVLTPPLKGLSALPAVFRGNRGAVEVHDEVKVTLGGAPG